MLKCYARFFRAAFVREAARFKPTRNVLDVPSRDAEVIERAVTGAVQVHLPQVVARSIFTAIINSSVAFEECVVSLGLVLVVNTAAF